MITSKDTLPMKVTALRKLASSSGLKRVVRGESEVSIWDARRAELIAALFPPEASQAQPQAQVQVEVQKQELDLDMFALGEEEKAEVEKALAISGMTLLELARAGLLMKARRIVTDYTKVESLTPEQRRNTTLAGAAMANLRATADRIVAWNHACYNNDLRVYLNASILRNLTGSNLNTIKDFLSLYRTSDDFLHTPDEHNQHYGLSDKDNRKGRDEFGNKIRISELIKLPIPQRAEESEVTKPVEEKVDLQSVVVENLSPEKAFSQRIDQLESEADIKVEAERLMAELIKVNGSKGFSSFKKLVTPYRKEIESLRLRSHNSEAKLVTTDGGMQPDSWLKTHSELPKGAEFNEQGNIISYPVHVALKYLSAELYKAQFAK